MGGDLPDLRQTATGALRTLVLVGLVFALLATWRREVISLPPYYGAAMSLFRRADALAESNFDFGNLPADDAPVDRAGANDLGPSVLPMLLALLMWVGLTTKGLFVVAHLWSFAAAAVIVVMMYRLLQPTTDPLFAWSFSLAAITTPLVLAQTELMGVAVPMTACALVAARAAVHARFGVAVAASSGAFLMSPWGLIVTVVSLTFAVVAPNLPTSPGGKTASRPNVGRAVAIHLLALVCQLGIYWSSMRHAAGPPLRMHGWLSEIRYQSPDLGLLTITTLGAASVAIVRGLARSPKPIQRDSTARGCSGPTRVVSHILLLIWCGLLVGASLTASYFYDQSLVIPHVLLVVPFLYLGLGLLLYRRSYPRLSSAVPVVLLLLNIGNAAGSLFPALPAGRRDSVSLQRSREYLADLRAHLAAMQRLAVVAGDTPIVAGYPFTHYLSFPRLGYVERPLAGYGTMPLANSRFRPALQMFRDHPQRLIFVYCAALSHAPGQISISPPAADKRAIFADPLLPALVVYEQDLAALGSDAVALEQWYIDHLWGADVAGAPPGLWISRAQFLASQGRADLALRTLESHVRQAPHDLLTRIRLAMLFVESGRNLDSIRHSCLAVRESIARQNLATYADAQYLLGVGMLAERRMHDARARFAEVLLAVPKYAEAHFQRGLSYLIEQRPADAEREFLAALRDAPDHAAAYYHLGRAHEQAQHPEQAITAYQRALQLRPDYFEACAQLANALVQADRPHEAVACFRQALVLRRDWLPGLNALCWLLATASDATVRNAREAVQGAEALCQQTGFQDPTALDTLAAAYAASGDFRRAMEILQRAIQLQAHGSSPANAEPLRKRLELYQRGQPYRQEERS